MLLPNVAVCALSVLAPHSCPTYDATTCCSKEVPHAETAVLVTNGAGAAELDADADAADTGEKALAANTLDSGCGAC